MQAMIKLTSFIEGCIDLHWRITQHYLPFPLDMEALWQRVETIELEGKPVSCLSPEDTLLLLCVHGTVHRWAELGWISDIACLIERFPTLDSEGVLVHSRHLNSERMVLLGLSLCRDLLGTELPTGVLNRIAATPRVEALRANVVQRLWTQPVTQWQCLVHYGLAAQTLSRFSDRMRFWWRTAGWVLGSRLKGKVKRWAGNPASPFLNPQNFAITIGKPRTVCLTHVLPGTQYGPIRHLLQPVLGLTASPLA